MWYIKKVFEKERLVADTSKCENDLSRCLVGPPRGADKYKSLEFLHLMRAAMVELKISCREYPLR